MQLYRFSPILNEAALLEAAGYLHETCHKLCIETIGKYLPVSGTIGIFCHDYNEFAELMTLKEKLTDAGTNYKQKYFKLLEPIVIEEKNGIPGASYEFLYIRQLDPYRPQVGDIDFVMNQDEYSRLKAPLQVSRFLNNARIFERSEENMIEIWKPTVDAISYIVTEAMQDKIGRE